jgi:hypothetical protein
MSTFSLPVRHLAPSARLLAVLLLPPLALGLLLGLQGDVGAWARHLLPLSFHPRTPTTHRALALYTHNLRVIATPLLGALLLSGLRSRGKNLRGPRALLDAFLGFSALSNAALLTISLTGYGLGRMASWLPHLPFEFGAVAVALTTYLGARRRALPASQLLGAAAICVVLRPTPSRTPEKSAPPSATHRPDQ